MEYFQHNRAPSFTAKEIDRIVGSEFRQLFWGGSLDAQLFVKSPTGQVIKELQRLIVPGLTFLIIGTLLHDIKTMSRNIKERATNFHYYKSLYHTQVNIILDMVRRHGYYC